MKLVVNNLSIAYQGGAQTVRPIDGFDMSVESGELVLLNGPSGSGKTTLLSAIAGLLTPEAGSITFDGEDVAGLRGKAMLRHRRDRIGMVFQSFNLIPSLTGTAPTTTEIGANAANNPTVRYPMARPPWM